MLLSIGTVTWSSGGGWSEAGATTLGGLVSTLHEEQCGRFAPLTGMPRQRDENRNVGNHDYIMEKMYIE